MGKKYDLLIIGASAAGISAAIYAARRRLNFCLVTFDIGGEVATSGEIENYPGFNHTDGIELTEKFKAQLRFQNVKAVESVRISRIDRTSDGFTVTSQAPEGERVWSARSVILATGAHPKLLGVPGEKELRGKGVTYCTTCDGPLFKNKIVATVGGGNSALESALMLSEIASRVYVVNKNPKFKGDRVLIEKLETHTNVEIIYNALTKNIEGGANVTGLRYQQPDGTEQTIQVQGVFIHIGLKPNSDMVDFVDKTPSGEVVVDLAARASVPGFFAAGDVTNIPYKQIAVATGQGVAAALSAVTYLNGLVK